MENDVDIPTENLQEPTTYEVMNKEEVNTAKGGRDRRKLESEISK